MNGCNIVALLAARFAILLVAPRAFCSLHPPPAALTNAHYQTEPHPEIYVIINTPETQVELYTITAVKSSIFSVLFLYAEKIFLYLGNGNIATFRNKW